MKQSLAHLSDVGRALFLRVATCLYRYVRIPILRVWLGVLKPARWLAHSYQKSRGIVRVETNAEMLAADELVCLEAYSKPTTIVPPAPQFVLGDVFWKFRQASAVMPLERVLFMEGGRTCGEDGAVITCRGTLLREFSGCYFAVPDSHPLLHRLVYPAVQVLTGKTVNLGVPKSANYYHWLFDVLPRLQIAWQAVKPADVDHYLVDHRHAFQRESLAALGVSLERCVQTSVDSHYCCEHMVVPSLRRGILMESVRFLRETFLENAGDCAPIGGRKLYITRQGCSRRRVLNEPAVVELLRGYGFEVLDPGTLSLGEQVSAFRDAEFIVAAHGGALTNLVFCSSGCRVIEMFSPNYVNVCFWKLAGAVGARYAYVLGEGRVPPEGRDPHVVYDDMRIDVEKLEPLVQRLLSQS